MTDEDDGNTGLELSVSLDGAKVRVDRRILARVLDSVGAPFRWLFSRKSARSAIDAAATQRLVDIVGGEGEARPIDALMFERFYGAGFQRQLNGEAAVARTCEMLGAGYKPAQLPQLPAGGAQARATSPEWFARWLRDAEDVTTESVRDLYARLLAGELEQARSFSLQTLTVVRDLDMETAEVFSRLRPLYFASGCVPALLSLSRFPSFLPWKLRPVELQRLKDSRLVSSASNDALIPLTWARVNDDLAARIAVGFQYLRIVIRRSVVRPLEVDYMLEKPTCLAVEPLTVAGQELMAIVESPDKRGHLAIARWIFDAIIAGSAYSLPAEAIELFLSDKEDDGGRSITAEVVALE